MSKPAQSLQSNLTKHLKVGAEGEAIAKDYLLSRDYVILAENWRFKNHHEIDLVCESPRGDLVAVEVRSHQQAKKYKPFESIDNRKISRIKNALRMYERENLEETPAMRVDVISVIIKIKEIEHFESVDNQL